MPHYLCAGKGTVIYKNGDKYEGDWAQGLRHGLGTLWLYKKGKYVVRYNGEWRNDAPSVSVRCSCHSTVPQAAAQHCITASAAVSRQA